MLQFYAQRSVIKHTLTLNSNMTKITLLSALTALLILPSIASAASTADFDTTTNATWLRVFTLAKMSDGESSHGQQTMMMNITALPEGGAKSRRKIASKPTLLLSTIALQRH